jgi:hypothetical protein
MPGYVLAVADHRNGNVWVATLHGLRIRTGRDTKHPLVQEDGGIFEGWLLPRWR